MKATKTWRDMLSKSLSDPNFRKEWKEANAELAELDKIIAARRRLIDSGFAIMQDGIEKELKINAENFKRQIEDLSRNGELTKALKANLLKAEQLEEFIFSCAGLYEVNGAINL